MSEMTINTALDNYVESAFQGESPTELPGESLKEETPDESPISTDESPQVEEPAEEQEAVKVYLNDFAKDAEVEVADVYQLSVPLGDDLGDESISELKDFRVQNADIVAKKQELTDRENGLAEREERLRDVPKISNEIIQARAKVLSIQDQYNAVNWDQLRVENAAEWTARQQEFQMAFSAAKAEEARAEESTETQKRQAKQFALDRVLEAMPELRDQKVLQETDARILDFVSRYGFTSKDLASITDPNLMRLLVDVSKLDVAKEQAKHKMKDKTPKASKPGRKPIPTTRKASLDRLKERAMKGTKKDKEAFIDALLT